MKISVIGVGMVGSSIAYTLSMSGMASKIVLVDKDFKRAVAEAMDISHATVLGYGTKVVAGNYEDIKESDIVIVTAGANQKSGETRLELLGRNAEIFKAIIPEIKKYANDCILIVATNPVDIMTEIAYKLSMFDKNKVIGTGTVLDSARFRSVLGAKLGISSRSIHANVIGEHGDSEVLLWSGAVAGTSPISKIAKDVCCNLDDELKREIEDEVRNSAYKIIDGKGSTYFGIASAVRHIVKAIIDDSHAILNVSSYHEKDVGGMGGVCYAMPSIVGREGVIKTLKPVMNETEKEELIKSVKILIDTEQSIKL